MNNIEILAPAGDYESFIQAINNGADAVYIAGKSFGARASAKNFSNDEIFEMIKDAHLLGVKVYVTVNTLIKDSEFEDAIAFIKELYINDVDAVIVQDLGLMDEIIRRFPDLDVHASTQVNVHSVAQAMFLKQLGVKRIILARETPLITIKEICNKVDIEIEVFVHGALCMSYSGNCYLSSMIGGRSGNRGRCAQPCRLRYSLDDEKAYLLSPKDLMAIDYLQELKEIGVHSFKIEGRMRRPEYVGLAVKAYKDALINGNTDYHKSLALMFTREFTKGFMFNESNDKITNTKSSNHIGLNIGKVIGCKLPYAFIILNDEVSLGDSIRITGPVNDAVTISEMYVDGNFTEYAKANQVIKVRVHEEVEIDSQVLKTTDAKLINEINNIPDKKIPILGKLFIKNNRLILSISDGNNIIESVSEVEIQEARNPEFNERIIAQIKKTNDTIYYFEEIIPLDKPVFMSIKEINSLRRNALIAMDQSRIKRNPREIKDIEYITTNVEKQNKMFTKVVNLSQATQAVESGIKDLIIENEFTNEDINIYHISPRISSRNKQYNASNNIGSIGTNCLLTGVYLNVFNARTVNLLHRLGVKTVGLSFELSKNEMKDLVDTYINLYKSEPNLMVMVYGHYELMIMKHCLINKAAGEKSLFCNKCDEKLYHLVDRKGSQYPLLNDGACHLRLLNDKRLHLLTEIPELNKIGISNILLDFTIEDELKSIISLYLKAFNKEVNDDNFLTNTTLGHYKEGIL